MKTCVAIFAVFAGLMISSNLRADGFSLEGSLKKEPHVVLALTDSQIETVGKWRRLDLTKEQISLLREKGVKSPKTLGVMSYAEPDCGCCIAPAYWMDKGHVVIWLGRLKSDKDGGKWYYNVRLTEGRYVIDASGNLLSNGKSVSLAEFEEALRKPRKKGGWIQVSLNPDPPKKLYAKLQALQRKYKNFGFRM